MLNEIVILGAGESGVGAALLAKAKGFRVFVSDKGSVASRYRDELLNNNIDFEEGSHSVERILKACEVIKSPGIPDNAPIIIQIKQKGIPVIAEIEFAGRYSSANMIGITGSNGKTTTTMWIHYILSLAGKDAVLSGNVGLSPCRVLVNRDPEIFVMELSSFQLDGMFSFRCNTAILTNITPDHLDRYDYKFENYIQSKFRILQNQMASDAFVFCADDPVTSSNVDLYSISASRLPFSVDKNEAAFVCDGELVINVDEVCLRMAVSDIALKGRHNLYNAMAAGIAAIRAGASVANVLEGLSSFKGVEHRLEFCGEVDGVTYINDSKATNVDSAWYALESINKPIVWIAGGTDKGNDYSSLMQFASTKVKALICMGLDNRKLVAAFSGVIPIIQEAQSMQQAMHFAKNNACNGDVVLLSPACASFDLFNNYEHRGKLFKDAVMQYKL